MLALILALLLSGLAFLAGVWIVVPALSSDIWKVALGASEWSLALTAAALVGLLLGIVALRSTPFGIVPTSLGVVALGLSLVPLWQAWPVARDLGIGLNPFGVLAPAPSDLPIRGPSTLTFARPQNTSLALDAYLPTVPSAGGTPAIVVIHGGAWSGGDKSDFPVWNGWLATQGYAVFDAQYRLAPQPNWQSATGDVKCAVGWVRQHASDFGVDAARIALMGRSAGGHLALLAAYTANTDVVPPTCQGSSDTSVRAVIGLYAPTDLAWGYDHPLNPRVLDGQATERAFLGTDPVSNPERYRQASPVEHVDASTPPTLLFHGGRDQLVSPVDMQRLADRLQGAAVPHQAVLIPYAQHGFDYNFNGLGSQIERPVILAFLREHL